ncbi:hypothetical protein U3A58_06295 [Algoriphagus sp. C2-6-M1]|uniref:hypothetical protein n=1 Tax=Algoriphagus persicinus TaxID=3108754 RepID=UPI002B3FA0E8|nr:hypothetical protein [Algoriphagus sp. C2-6-M1]MEB2779994.1 hypothetical protein [Algoriphagus sp. C2-6-M1]
MKKDFHIELIYAINEPEEAKWDYLDNLRKESKLSKAGFIAKLKQAKKNIFTAWEDLEKKSKLRLPDVDDLSFPYNSFLYYPHLKDFSTQFHGHINEQNLKTLENFIRQYELRTLQKEFLKKANKAQSSKDDAETKKNEEGIKNIFNSMPIEQVREHFRPLTEKENPKKMVWMTSEDFEIFLSRSFGKVEDLEKPKINLGHGAKLALVKLFYQFYEKSQIEYYSQNRSKEPFLNLLKDAFLTKEFNDLDASNFKASNSKYEWD